MAYLGTTKEGDGMSLLPISKSDLKLCAERWGWEHLPGLASVWTPKGRCYFGVDNDDADNSPAILDRERVLMLKGVYGGVTLYGDYHVYTWSGTMNGINIPEDHLAAPNFRSWLLVQLTLALPPEVWE
jgi:hypothetical protein